MKKNENRVLALGNIPVGYRYRHFCSWAKRVKKAEGHEVEYLGQKLLGKRCRGKRLAIRPYCHDMIDNATKRPGVSARKINSGKNRSVGRFQTAGCGVAIGIAGEPPLRSHVYCFNDAVQHVIRPGLLRLTSLWDWLRD